MPSPETTYLILLVVQALHLLHHRLAHRHISFVEVIAGAVLCVPLSVPVPALLLSSVHLALVAIQVIGSLFIEKLSPRHDEPSPLAKMG